MTTKKERKMREKTNAILRKEPPWKHAQRIVAILEKSLSPNAKVQHDVWLPVIGMKELRRQCDVVITYGEQPRDFLSIVEVQKRNSKPDINTFDGWVTKMNDVGAQQLICVSAKGYPKSIINKVNERLGKRRVCLLTLEELIEGEMPGLSLPIKSMVEKTQTFSIQSVGLMKLNHNVPASEFKLDTSDRVFGYNELEERFSLLDLASLGLRYLESERHTKGLPVPNRFNSEFELGSGEGGELWFYWKGQRFNVSRLPIKIEVTIRATEVPVTIFLYKQDDKLIWVLSKAGTPTENESGTHVIFQQGKTGFVDITSVQMPEDQRLTFYFSEDKAAIEAGHQQSLQSASEIQDVPIINFGESTSVFDVSIDQLVHIRDCTDRALHKKT